MPLARLNEGVRPELDGVAFGMLDGRRTVNCLVTYGAITDAMGGNPTQDDMVRWFKDNRASVEHVASAMFDRHAVTHPQLVVRTRDLNPHLFKK